MIRFIKGNLAKKEDGFLIVEVNGIGVGVEIPTPIVSQLPEVGSTIELHTYLRMGDDGLALYGFLSPKERDIFEILINTSGLGPRMSLAILSALPIDEFVQAILDKNIPMLTKIPGIGKKKAERIIVELKDKISLYSTAMAETPEEQKLEISEKQRVRINDAIEALISLGMKPNEATKAIYSAFRELGSNTTTTELIKLGLKYK
ncbi:Holliday junction branch migration protein RuvA [Candidatus Sumerlaeota bacterium]|nr:Holliday junction branch migration protein RuvA [Candidatus Sumerlaeota bacterium]